MPRSAERSDRCRLKVLMITTDHLMIDRRILQEAESLRDAGFVVEILAGFECAQSSSYDHHGIPISRFVFDWSDARVARILHSITARTAWWWPYLWRGTRRAVSLATGISSFEHFVLSHVMRREFDILHVHDFPLLRVGAEVKKRRGCALVYDAHELYHAQAQLPSAIRRRYRRLERKLIGAADLSITVNPYIAGIMARDYACKAPMVILNAAPQAPKIGKRDAELRQRFGIRSTDRVVLYQGWMSPERGIDVLVKSARHFPDDVRLVLVGYGACEADLVSISRQQGTDDGRVLFLGRMEPKELSVLTAQADLGIIPYKAVDLNHLYCSPNKLFEYAVAELPFLANDLPYLREVVDTYGFGAIADLSTPESAAAAIVNVVRDDQRISELRAAARRAAELLNWGVEGRKLVTAYGNIRRGERVH